MGVLALLVIALAAMLLFAKELVELAASTATGREIQIAGAFDIDYSLSPRIHAAKVTVANPDWSGVPNGLSAKSLTVQVDLRALLHGNLVLPEVRLESPVLLLEKTVQGPANWQLGGSSQQRKLAGHQWPCMPSIGHFSIGDGRINYLCFGKNLKVIATIDTLEAEAALDLPLSLASSGRINGEAYELTASGAPIGSLAGSAATGYPHSLHLSTAPMKVHAGGKLGAPLTENNSDSGWWSCILHRLSAQMQAHESHQAFIVK